MIFLPGQARAAKVAVAAAAYHIDRPYDYRIPEALSDKVVPGVRVVVPFGRGNRKTEGLVLAVGPDSGVRELKCVLEVIDPSPVLSPEMVKLAIWMGERFFCPVYDAARAMLPAGMWYKEGKRRVTDRTVAMASLAIPAEEAVLLAEQKRRRAPQQAHVLEVLSRVGEASMHEIAYFTGATRATITRLAEAGVVSIEEREVFRRPETGPVQAAEPIVLTDAQQAVFDSLVPLLDSRKAEAALLYGVTGSGKTSVYIRLIEETIKRGRDAIVLVPEIALTPQLIATFTAHFGDIVAVLHSALTMGERYDEWKRIRSGLVRVVVGTRSAVFAPVGNLGLVVIDEEQEHTYKSENSPRYHAREVAKYRCVASGALLLLGSATPSLESMHSAAAGRYRLFRLDSRYNERELPPVLIADMKEELKKGNGGIISSLLLEELTANIERGEQSILFLNRRGDSAFVACGECGFTFACPRCSVSVTYHSANRRFMCHYCGYSEPARERCPDCGGKLKYFGAGTQKAEAELKELLPEVEIIRMDSDTVLPARSHEALLRRFREERIPILLGTQMVAKGLDFENVTLVGVLSADQMLYLSDYRAHERAFALITQVVGRSGRGTKPGRAVIQTFTPQNEVIRLAARQDYDAFYARELEFRRLSGCPPLADLIALTVSGQEEPRVLSACVWLRRALEGCLRGTDGLRILGPAPAAVARVNNRYRYRVSVLCRADRRTRAAVAFVIREFYKEKGFRGLHAFADADPYEA